MAKYTLSLRLSSKGQIVIEALFVIAFLLVFVTLLQNFHSTSQKQIQKERLSKNRINKKAPWIKALKRDQK